MPAAHVYKIADADDPKAEALKQLGDLSRIRLAPPRVLLWTFIRSRKLASGLYVPDKEVKEDVHQGVVGLVLKKGDAAFVDDDEHKFHGFKAEVGEWVLFKPGNAQRVQINGVDCRYIEDTLVDMVIDDPESVTHRQ